MKQVMVKLIGFGYSFTHEHKGMIVKANCTGEDHGKGSTFYEVDYRDLVAAGAVDAYAVGGNPMLIFVGEADSYDIARQRIQDFTYYCEVGDYRGNNVSDNPRHYVSKRIRRQKRWGRRVKASRREWKTWDVADIPWL